MLVIGISGTALTQTEREWLLHPAVGGVILFRRNFESRSQIMTLAAELRAAAARPLLLCVDQEGGPVQRFEQDFSRLPALARFGQRQQQDPQAALNEAREHAWLMASEIRATGIDLSFAPVLDLQRGNRAIGERAFAPDPQQVAAFARCYIEGMHAAGMAATLKHFPGHGSVLEDTHFDAAVDPRPLDAIRADDLLPFAAGIAAGAEAVMMAHVTYPALDPEPAGYSRRWIDLLRGELGFRGVVFSDDIGMAAAKGAGGVEARLRAHYAAGCDAVLVCAPALVPASLAALPQPPVPGTVLHPLLGRASMPWEALVAQPRWQQARATLEIAIA